MPTNRFTVTLQYSYEQTDEEVERFYKTTNLGEAAVIDQQNFQDDPAFLIEDIYQGDRSYAVYVTAEKVDD